jgi:predicted RNase H-like HicB family nuclease
MGPASDSDRYAYAVAWSEEDGEYVGRCGEFPSLSWLDKTPETALAGIRALVADVVADLQASGESIPGAKQVLFKFARTDY